MGLVIAQIQDTLVGVFQTPGALAVMVLVNVVFLSGLGARLIDR